MMIRRDDTNHLVSSGFCLCSSLKLKLQENPHLGSPRDIIAINLSVTVQHHESGVSVNCNVTVSRSIQGDTSMSLLNKRPELLMH